MHCLVIKNVAPGQSGVYSCVAKSGVGEVVCKAELTVLPESDQSFSSDNEHAATNSQKFCGKLNLFLAPYQTNNHQPLLIDP